MVQSKILQFVTKLAQEKQKNHPQEGKEPVRDARKPKKVQKSTPGNEGRSKTPLEKWLQSKETRTEGEGSQQSRKPEDTTDQERKDYQETEEEG